MAVKRRIGNLADTLLKSRLVRRQAREQSDMIGQRQLELALFNQEGRRDQSRLDREAATQASLIDAALKDPTGRLIEQLFQSGQSQLGPIRNTPERATNILSSSIDQADDLKKLPTIGGIFNQANDTAGFENEVTGGSNQAMPQSLGGDGLMTPGLSTIDRLIQQAQNRKTQLQQALPPQEQKFIDESGRPSTRMINPFEAAAGPALPTEKTADQASTYANTVDDQTRSTRVKTAGEVASVEANARQAAETRGVSERERQSWTLAAENPAIAGMAEALINDSEILKEIPPQQLGFVFAALKSDKFKTQATKKSEALLNTMWDALNELQTTKGKDAAIGGSLQKGATAVAAWAAGVKPDADGSYAPFPGTNAAAYATVLEKFRSAAVAGNLTYMRGLGHMSDRDIKVIQGMSTNLNKNVPQDFFDQQMKKARLALIESYRKIGIEPPPVPPDIYNRPPADPALVDRLNQRRNR